MSTELAIIESLELVPFFTKGESVDDILAKIKAEAMAHVPDVSSGKGRKAITANITKVTNSKTYLEDNGKKLSAEHKLIPGVIDANRKKVKDFLNALQADLRKPLTDWEEEQARIKAEKLAVEEAKNLAAKIESDHEMALLMNDNIDREVAEAKAMAEQERITREEEMKRQAAEAARIEAEQKAAAEIELAKREKQEAIKREAKAKQDVIDVQAKADKSEQDRIAAEKARKEEIRIDYHKRMVQHIIDCGNGFIGGSPQSFGVLFYELENKIVIDESFEEFRQEAETARSESLQKLKDCQERQAKDHEEAEAKAKHDTEVAAENARLAEVQRQKQKADQLRAEQSAREADLDNRAAKNNAAKDAIIALRFNELGAKAIVKAIAKGLIPDVTINY